MLQRFIFAAGGASAKTRALEPAALAMSRGVCGPKPWQMSAAAAGPAKATKAAAVTASFWNTMERPSLLLFGAERACRRFRVLHHSQTIYESRVYLYLQYIF